MTAQFHERLILNGEQTSMAFCPPIPDDHPNIVTLSPQAMSEGIKKGEIDQFVFSTACWRQYIGTWEVKDERFYLVHVGGRFKVNGEPVLAEWFTGTLRIPRGEQLQYVHMGFGSVYEEELHIRIENGLVIKYRLISNKGKDIDQWGLGAKNLPGGENSFDGDDDW